MALEADPNQGVLLLMSMATLPLRIRNSFKRTFNGFPEIPEGLLPDAEIFVSKEWLKSMKAFAKPAQICVCNTSSPVLMPIKDSISYFAIWAIFSAPALGLALSSGVPLEWWQRQIFYWPAQWLLQHQSCLHERNHVNDKKYSMNRSCDADCFRFVCNIHQGHSNEKQQ